MEDPEEKNADRVLDEIARQRGGLSRLPKEIGECWECLTSIRGHVSLNNDGGDLVIESRVMIPKKAILGAVILGYILTKGEIAQYLASIF